MICGRSQQQSRVILYIHIIITCTNIIYDIMKLYCCRLSTPGILFYCGTRYNIYIYIYRYNIRIYNNIIIIGMEYYMLATVRPLNLLVIFNYIGNIYVRRSLIISDNIYTLGMMVDPSRRSTYIDTHIYLEYNNNN